MRSLLVVFQIYSAQVSYEQEKHKILDKASMHLCPSWPVWSRKAQNILKASQQEALAALISY